MKLGVMILAVVIVSGCATSPVIGPFSYMTSNANEQSMLKRSIIQSKMEVPKKQQLLSAVNMGARGDEVALGIGIDLGQMIAADSTWGEVGKQFLGVIGDLGLYTAIGAGIKELTDKDEDSSSATTVNNYGNTYTIDNQSGNVNQSITERGDPSSGDHNNNPVAGE